MMGRQVARGSLFHGFRLDDHVPADHLLRRVDGLLDFGFVREALAGSYSASGRPSVDPELMLRMLLVGYLLGVRSERRLCEEVHLNLAYRWFRRLDLGDQVPDHSTFSTNRHGRFRKPLFPRRRAGHRAWRVRAQGQVLQRVYLAPNPPGRADAGDRRGGGQGGNARASAGRGVGLSHREAVSHQSEHGNDAHTTTRVSDLI
jgi:hypothetical protein